MTRKIKNGEIEVLCSDGYKRRFTPWKGIHKGWYCCADCHLFVIEPDLLQEHTCQSAIINKDKLYDRWGEYFILTGNESLETCFWCGKTTKKRYCTEDCRINYLRSYNWKFASGYCLDRYENKCADCGTMEKSHVQDGVCSSIASGYCRNYKCTKHEPLHINEYYYNMDGICTHNSTEFERDTKMEVHHVDPMLGEDRNWSKKNVPENLVCMCHRCHRIRHNHDDNYKQLVSDKRTLKANVVMESIVKKCETKQLTLF